MALLPYYLPFLGGMGAQGAAQAYGMVGGIPLYLQQFDGGMSLQDNVCANHLFSLARPCLADMWRFPVAS